MKPSERRPRYREISRRETRRRHMPRYSIPRMRSTRFQYNDPGWVSKRITVVRPCTLFPIRYLQGSISDFVRSTALSADRTRSRLLPGHRRRRGRSVEVVTVPSTRYPSPPGEKEDRDDGRSLNGEIVTCSRLRLRLATTYTYNNKPRVFLFRVVAVSCEAIARGRRVRT